MSFISKAWKSVRNVVAPIVGTAIGGPGGALLGRLLGGSTSKVPSIIEPVPVASPTASFGGRMGSFAQTLGPAATVLPGIGQMAGRAAGAALPSLLTGGTVATVGRAAVVSARRLASGAASLCRKHPQWCATIGGMAAVEALMRSGQLPVPKRRRGRGITANELRAFKRVARFTSKYCAPVRRAMHAPAVRKGRSCQ